MKAQSSSIPTGCYQTPSCIVLNIVADSSLLLAESQGGTNENFNPQINYGDGNANFWE